MKKTALILATTLFATTSQAQVKIETITENIAGGSHEAYKIEIYNPDEEVIEKKWKSLMKDYDAKFDYDKKTKEYFADNARIKTVSTNDMDIYAKILPNKTEKRTILIVSVDLGGAFLNPTTHADKHKNFEKVLYDFAITMNKEAIQANIEMAEEELKKTEKDLNSKEKEKEKAQENIADAKKKIEENENKVKDNNKEQEVLREKIGKQKQAIEDIKQLKNNTK